VTVLNKSDRLDDATLQEKREALSALAPNPVVVSARTGENVDTLCERIHAELPDFERERLVLPMTEDTMSVVSWIHDNAHVETVEYGEQVTIEFEARPSVVARSRNKATELVAEASA
jgi:GTP-binding protein HflX